MAHIRAYRGTYTNANRGSRKVEAQRSVCVCVEADASVGRGHRRTVKLVVRRAAPKAEQETTKRERRRAKEAVTCKRWVTRIMEEVGATTVLSLLLYFFPF